MVDDMKILIERPRRWGKDNALKDLIASARNTIKLNRLSLLRRIYPAKEIPQSNFRMHPIDEFHQSPKFIRDEIEKILPLKKVGDTE